MKKNTIIVGLIVAALAAVGGGYYLFIVKGGTLAVSLPKAFHIDKQQLVVEPASTTETGAVLGESENYENPLKDIYVNPFAK